MDQQHNYQEYLDNLGKIKSLMEQSTRFFSLSGLSGVFAGIYALVGAAAAYFYINGEAWGIYSEYSRDALQTIPLDMLGFFALDALLVLVLSLATGYYFSARKAFKSGESLWNKVAMRMVINLFIPLVTGGVFCLILLTKGVVSVVPGATLIFYGLGLLNASKYTYRDIRYLGISEIMVGLMGVYFAQFGLLFWALGFGVLHVIYGAVMYFKYDRQSA